MIRKTENWREEPSLVNREITPISLYTHLLRLSFLRERGGGRGEISLKIWGQCRKKEKGKVIDMVVKWWLWSVSWSMDGQWVVGF